MNNFIDKAKDALGVTNTPGPEPQEAPRTEPKPDPTLSVEQINHDFQELQEKKSGPHPDFVAARLKEQENEEKKKKLLELIDSRVEPIQKLEEENAQKIDGLIVEVSKIAQVLQVATNPQEQPQQPQEQGQAPNPASALSSLPPEIAGPVVSNVLSGLAQVIAAFRQGGTPQEPNQFAAMSQEITMNMLRAGVDGIMQNVYQNYNPTPPAPSWHQRPQQPQQHNHGLE